MNISLQISSTEPQTCKALETQRSKSFDKESAERCVAVAGSVFLHPKKLRARFRIGFQESRAKFIVMVATEKSSCDPREDFRGSIVEMIRANNMYKVNDLRRLLNCYLSMNSEEYRGVILEVFYETVDLESGPQARVRKIFLSFSTHEQLY